MGKTYKLNKSELTRLKQEEKIYLQFLPVLKLKQEQLQIEQIRTKKKCSDLNIHYNKLMVETFEYISVLPDTSNPYKLEYVLSPKKISITEKSVAGIRIPTLESVTFSKYSVNFFDSACWFIIKASDLRTLVMKNIEIQIAQKQYTLISKELKKATQRVNLFEKVLVPETKEAIKKINIILGDEQVSSVCRAKTAKNKIINVS